MTLVPDGYSDVPARKIATIVTCLEMLHKPNLNSLVTQRGWSLELIQKPQADWYQSLFRRLGEPWLWVSRAQMSLSALQEILDNSQVKVYVFRHEDAEEGLLELDFRRENECELAFLGLTNNFTGKGIGKWLMNQAIQTAWSHSIHRFWVHTCTLDGPEALPFYIKSGFVPYKRQVEVFDDPRLTGVYPLTAAPRIPII